MNNILIIGSKGFIGSKLMSVLHNNGKNKIFCSDIIKSNESNYVFLNHKKPNFDKLVKITEFDICINCSGSANVQYSINNPLDDFFSNLVNVGKILNSIIKFNPNCKFINISSAAVYGNPESLPIKKDAPLQPLSPYGVHKLLADILITEYHKIFKLKTCTVRIFSAYGNGQKKLFLWDCFQKLSKAETNQKVSFFGTGLESRDFIHIDDIIRQLELVMNNAAFEGEVYNVANGEEVFIKDVVAIMQKALHTNASVTFTGENRPGDPLNWRADIAPMLNWGYKKSVSIEDGIKQYVKWALGND